MKKRIQFPIIIFQLILLMMTTGCASRFEMPVVDEDSTLVYPAKKADGVSVKITLCRDTDKKTGERIGVGRIFSIMEKGRIEAFIDIQNGFILSDQEMMFHIDWVGPDGKSFYQKRIDLSPSDSTKILNSSISISPNTREPGEYTLRIYHFRELIAERKFELLPEFELINAKGEALSGTITLCSKVSRKTGEMTGIDSVFIIREKANVRAYVDLKNRFVYGKRELMFRFEWLDSTAQSFYQKEINLTPGDSITTINSSISISPDKRQPGDYSLQIYLFNELIAEKKFELIPEPKIIPVKPKKMKATIMFCSHVDKETGDRTGKGIIFTTGEKERVNAFIELENGFAFGKKNLKFHLEWIGPDGQAFYKKQIDLPSDDPSVTLTSSISIPPDKREPGKYNLQVYLFDELIAEKAFELQ